MKKLYLDQSELKSCIGIFLKDTEVINAGTTVNAMSAKHKNTEYDRYATEYGIHFIFEDDVPVIDFYAIPQIDIFATDGEGGMFGSVGEETNPRGESAIIFISDKKEVHLVAANFKEFVSRAADWKNRLQPYDGITLYESKAEAEKEQEFIAPYELR